MTEPVEFTVKGEPVPKARARSVPRNGKIIHVTPPETRAYEAKVSWAARLAMKGRDKFPDRVHVRAVFYHKALKGRPKRGAGLTIPKGTKPDLDNLLKSILDGMNGIVYGDDGQVATVVAHKAWAPVGQEPRAEVRVTAITGEWPPDDELELF